MGLDHALDIVIIGAGLGGLAAAVALAGSGHRVTVLEATTEIVTAGAGLQVPSPSTKILRSWGLETALKSKITEPKDFCYRSFQDGHIIGSVPMNPFCEQRYGSPWWSIHRADYQKALLAEAVSRGAIVKLNHRVLDVDLSKPAVTVQHNGSTLNLNADLIIGADGLRSRIRSAILHDDEPASRLRPTNICAYRALVPAEAMKADELRQPLMTPEETRVTVWLGGSHFLLAYPIGQDDEAQYNLVLTHPEIDEHTKHDLPPRFPRPASIPEIAEHYSNFCPQVQSIISVLMPENQSEYWIEQMALAPKDGILEWKFSDLDEVPTWTDCSGRVVIIGDAAHAQRPYMAAGASTAVEDAAALATFLSPEALREHDLKELVDAFVAMRKPRVTKMQRLSSEDSDSWGLEQGSEQQRRDELLAYIDTKDMEQWARAMEQMKHEGIGAFNFGDIRVMDWAWGYDVIGDANTILEQMNKRPVKL